MTPERCQVAADPEEAGRGGRRIALARLLVRAFFLLCYNTNFLLNVTLSLTVVLPLLVVERVAGTAGRTELLGQVATTIYVALLYAVVYVLNDLIDYRRDLEQHPFKSSLLTQTGARRSAVVFGVWLSATLAAVTWRWPGPGLLLLAYTAWLLALSALHSSFRALKPVTIFVERFARVVAPMVFIYVLTPTAVTGVFLLSVLLAYPVMMDTDYQRYLRTKLAWHGDLRRWSRSLYASYWVVTVVGVLVAGSLGADHLALTAGHPPAAVSALLLAPVLLAVHSAYERAARRIADLVPDRFVPGGNPAYPGERKQSACELVLILALAGLVAVSA